MCSGWPATPIMMMISLASMADTVHFSTAMCRQTRDVRCTAPPATPIMTMRGRVRGGGVGGRGDVESQGEKRKSGGFFCR